MDTQGHSEPVAIKLIGTTQPRQLILPPEVCHHSGYCTGEGISCREHNGRCVTEVKLKEIDFSISCKSNPYTSSLEGDSTWFSKAGFKQIIQASRRQWGINTHMGAYTPVCVFVGCVLVQVRWETVWLLIWSLALGYVCKGWICGLRVGVGELKCTGKREVGERIQSWLGESWNDWANNIRSPRFWLCALSLQKCLLKGCKKNILFFWQSSISDGSLPWVFLSIPEAPLYFCPTAHILWVVIIMVVVNISWALVMCHMFYLITVAVIHTRIILR